MTTVTGFLMELRFAVYERFSKIELTMFGQTSNLMPFPNAAKGATNDECVRSK